MNDKPIIENPVWMKDPLDGEVRTVSATVNGRRTLIPRDLNNSQYKELMRQVNNEGLVVAVPSQ